MTFDKVNGLGICDDGVIDPRGSAVMELFDLIGKCVDLFSGHGMIEMRSQGAGQGDGHSRAGAEPGCNRDGRGDFYVQVGESSLTPASVCFMEKG